MIRHDWTLEELQQLYALPLIELLSQAHTVHIQYHHPGHIQTCALISIKTGGCPEDCKYCAQSSRYVTSIVAQPLMRFEQLIEEAKKAIEQGASRICLGAAWREVRSSAQFDEVVHMVRAINAMGVEVCCTLGMLKQEQAQTLKKAGLYAYNHNLDTSRNFYDKIITTRTYEDRLNTLQIAEESGLTLCCGGILGLGETENDRIQLIHTLATRKQHPASVPINQLSPIPGTPLQDQPPVSVWDLLRVIALARITMPQSMVRLSAGRIEMSFEAQALCFFTGVNSIFIGEKLLTASNPSLDKDNTLFHLLGLKKITAFNRTTCSLN